MRIPRPALALRSALGAILLLSLPMPGLAQDGTLTYTDGEAQLLVRVGPASLDAFSFVSGARDATTGRMTLRYAQIDGRGTLTIMTPTVAGAHAAAPRPPRGAAVTFRRVRGMTGQRGACTIAWQDLSASMLSGSFACPRERARAPKGKRMVRAGVVGTFTARAVPQDGVVVEPVSLPILPLGTPVEVAGHTVTVTGTTDLAAVCVRGTAKRSRVSDVECPARHVPVAGTFRAVALSVCVAGDVEGLGVLDRAGYSRVLFSGTTAALLPLGMPAIAVDPAVTTRGLRRFVNPDGCTQGHLVAGTQGPLVVWLPSGGATPVGWTLDPTTLPPTADGSAVEPTSAPASPAPVESLAPAGRTDLTSGAADALHDGAELVAVDDLVLTEGFVERDGTGGVRLHLDFASGSDTLTIMVPGAEGSFAWGAGAPEGGGAVAWRLGDVAVTAAESGCTVDVVPTAPGGVEGAWMCLPADRGSASGSFIANP